MASVVATVMRATSAFSPRRPDRRRAAGLTLLELLVVMSLLSLLAALIGPAAVRTVDNARERNQLAAIRATLATLPVRAFQQGRPIIVDAATLRTLAKDMPPEWDLQALAAIRYAANGVTTGGVVRLRRPGHGDLHWRIRPVTGEVDDGDGTPPQ